MSTSDAAVAAKEARERFLKRLEEKVPASPSSSSSPSPTAEEDDHGALLQEYMSETCGLPADCLADALLDDSSRAALRQLAAQYEAEPDLPQQPQPQPQTSSAPTPSLSLPMPEAEFQQTLLRMMTQQQAQLQALQNQVAQLSDTIHVGKREGNRSPDSILRDGKETSDSNTRTHPPTTTTIHNTNATDTDDNQEAQHNRANTAAEHIAVPRPPILTRWANYISGSPQRVTEWWNATLVGQLITLITREAQQRNILLLDGNLLFKFLFMCLVLGGRLSRKKPSQTTASEGIIAGIWLAYRMHILIFVIVAVYLIRSGILDLLIDCLVKRDYVGKLWRGEPILQDNPPETNQQEIDGQQAQLAPPRGNRQAAPQNNNDPNNPLIPPGFQFAGGWIRNPNVQDGLVLTFVYDLCYLLGSFVLSLFPIWNPQQMPQQEPPIVGETEVDNPVHDNIGDAHIIQDMDSSDDDDDDDDDTQEGQD